MSADTGRRFRMSRQGSHALTRQQLRFLSSVARPASNPNLRNLRIIFSESRYHKRANSAVDGASVCGFRASAQSARARKTGVSPRPRSVRRYSTRGGTSGYTVRATIPSRSSSRRCCVSIFCEARGIARWRSENLIVSFPERCARIGIFQRPSIQRSASPKRSAQTSRFRTSVLVVSFIVTFLWLPHLIVPSYIFSAPGLPSAPA